MKNFMVLAGLVLTPVLAWAGPIDLDVGSTSRINIVAKGVKAAGPAVAHGDLIEIPLEATDASGKIDSSDSDLSSASIIGGSHPRLVLKLHHSKHTVEKLAAALAASENDGALRISMPRQAPADAPAAATAQPQHEQAPAKGEPAKAESDKGANAKSVVPPIEKIAIAKPVIVDTKTQPKAEVPKAAVEKVEKIEKAEAPPAQQKAATELQKAVTAAATLAEQNDTAEAAAQPMKKSQPAIDIVSPDKLNLPSKPEPVTTDSLLDDHKANNRATWWILGALVIGIPALWFAGKQRKAGGLGGHKQQPLLKVLATQSLGGKSRLVMVDADGKRILLAVNDNNTRVVANLDQALAAATDEPLPSPRETEVDESDVLEDARAVARTYGDDLDIDVEEPVPAPPPRRENSVLARIPVAPRVQPESPARAAAANSSAIAGLLKLRADATGAVKTQADDNDSGPHDDQPGPSEWGDALRRAVARVKS